MKFYIKNKYILNILFLIFYITSNHSSYGMVAELSEQASNDGRSYNTYAQSEMIARNDSPAQTLTEALSLNMSNSQQPLSQTLQANNSTQIPESTVEALIAAKMDNASPNLHALSEVLSEQSSSTSNCDSNYDCSNDYDNNSTNSSVFFTTVNQIQIQNQIELYPNTTLNQIKTEFALVDANINQSSSFKHNQTTTSTFDFTDFLNKSKNRDLKNEKDKGYSKYHTKEGLPKSEKYDEKALEDSQISSSIGNQENIQNKITLYRLAKHATEQPQDLTHARNGIHFVEKATHNETESYSYSLLARATSHSLEEPTASKAILKCSHLTANFSNPKQRSLQDRAISYAATIADRLHSHSSNWCDKEHCENILYTINEYVGKMASGDTQAENILSHIFPSDQQRERTAAQAAMQEISNVDPTAGLSAKDASTLNYIERDFLIVQKKQAEKAFSNFSSHDHAEQTIQRSSVEPTLVLQMSKDRTLVAKEIHSTLKKSVDLNTCSQSPIVQEITARSSQASAAAYSTHQLSLNAKTKLLLQTSQALYNYAQKQETIDLEQIKSPTPSRRSAELTQQAAQELSHSIEAISQLGKPEEKRGVKGIGSDVFDKNFSNELGQQIAETFKSNFHQSTNSIDQCAEFLHKHNLDNHINTLKKSVNHSIQQIDQALCGNNIQPDLQNALHQIKEKLNNHDVFLSATDKKLHDLNDLQQETINCNQQEAFALEKPTNSLAMQEKFSNNNTRAWSIDTHITVYSNNENLYREQWQERDARQLQTFWLWLQQNPEHLAHIKSRIKMDQTRIIAVKEKTERLIEFSPNKKEALQDREDFITTSFGLPCFNTDTYQKLVTRVIDASVIKQDLFSVKFKHNLSSQEETEIKNLAELFLKEIDDWEKEGISNYRYDYNKEHSPDYSSGKFLNKELQYKKEFISFSAACEHKNIHKAGSSVYAFYKWTLKEENNAEHASVYFETAKKDFNQMRNNHACIDLKDGWHIDKKYASDPLVKSLEISFNMHDAKIQEGILRIRNNKSKIYRETLSNLEIKEPNHKIYGRTMTKDELLLSIIPCPGLHLCLKERSETKDTILKNCGIQKPTEIEFQTAYALLDKKPTEIADYLADTLSMDNPNKDTQRAYEHFYDNNHLPKNIKYDSQILNDSILPKTLSQHSHKEQRKLLAKFVLHVPKTEQENLGRIAGIHCIARACEANECAPLYNKYACSIENAFNGDEATVLSSDAIVKHRINNPQLEQQVLIASNQIISALQDPYYLSTKEQAEYRTTLASINKNVDLLTSGIPNNAEERLQKIITNHQKTVTQKNVISAQGQTQLEPHDYVITSQRSVTELTTDLKNIEAKINDLSLPQSIRELYKEVYDSRLKHKSEQAKLIQQLVLSTGEVAAHLDQTKETNINELVKTGSTLLRGAEIIIEEIEQIRQEGHAFMNQDPLTKLQQCTSLLTTNLFALAKVAGFANSITAAAFDRNPKVFAENIEQLTYTVDNILTNIQNMSGEEQFRLATRIGLETALCHTLCKAFTLSKANHKTMMQEIEKQIFTIQIEPLPELQQLSTFVTKEAELAETLERTFTAHRRAPPLLPTKPSSGGALQSVSQIAQPAALSSLTEAELTQFIKINASLNSTVQAAGKETIAKAIVVCGINPQKILEKGALLDLKNIAQKINVIESNPEWTNLAIDKTSGTITRQSVNTAYTKIQNLNEAEVFAEQFEKQTLINPKISQNQASSQKKTKKKPEKNPNWGQPTKIEGWHRDTYNQKGAWGHVFSEKHINNDILKLGKNKSDIFDKFMRVIHEVNEAGQLVEGDNDIRLVINNYESTIRPHLRNGIVMSFTAFAGISEQIKGKLIRWKSI